MSNGQKFYVARNPAWDSLDVYFKDGRAFAQDVVMREVEEAVIPLPVLRISFEAAQTLMDELWNAGVRPAESRYTSETFQAQDRHIKDLERVAFQLLDKATKGTR